MKKKKKKAKPRENNPTDGKVAKQKLFKAYNNEMEEKDQKTENYSFYLFQSIKNKELFRKNIFDVVYFYDRNFVGNKDFMHIPSIKNVLNNLTKYPIMLATQKNEYGEDVILGTTTVKYQNNKKTSDNPYFPTVNENILLITGVLTKQNAVDKNGNKIKGIGKELFKSSIKAAYNLNKEQNVRLICEVDCRNKNSLYSISKAVDELQKEKVNIQMFADGYYEIINKAGKLVEAPTIMLEVDLNKKKRINKKNLTLDYTNCKFDNLFSDLSNVICENTKEKDRFVNKKGDKTIIYHRIKPINALGLKLNVGNTAEGNERVPELKPLEVEIASTVAI